MHANRSLKPAELSTNQRRLEIIPQSLAELKRDPANPRRHSKKQIRQIAKIISVFGFNVPVLVDAALNVIVGHGRLLACRELGIDEVPTLCLEHLTPAQVRAFRIADNKLTENATWDERLLAEQLHDLSLSGLDFDIEVTGFEMGEIDLRIASLEDPPAEDSACAQGSSGRCQSETAARKAEPPTGSGPKRQCLPGVAAHSLSLRGGTASSNPSSSSAESVANLTFGAHSIREPKVGIQPLEATAPKNAAVAPG
jgi:hypothetical protein